MIDLQYIFLTALAATATPALAVVTSQYTASGNYTPSYVQCPTNRTFVRPASSGLGSGEEAWLRLRRPNVVNALEVYLQNANIPGFNTSAFINSIRTNTSNVPTIGLSFSGGGNRAEINGFGIYQGLDAKYPPALQAKTGGIAQALTYVAGISGGSFPTGSLALNGFPSVQALLQGGNLNLSETPEQVFGGAISKAELGFNLSLADFLGIGSTYYLSRDLANSSIDPLSKTWSGIQAQPAFQNGSVPMAILMANEVIPEGVTGSRSYDGPNGTILLTNNNLSTIYEYTPFEFGAWQGRVQAFTDLEYFGTTLMNGMPPANSPCVKDYDSAIFVIGTVINAVNYWIAQNTTNGTVGQFAKRDDVPYALGSIADSFDKRGAAHSDLRKHGKRQAIPYPPNEDEMEQLRVAVGSSGFLEQIPGILQGTGGTLQDILYSYVPNPFMGYTDGADAGAASQEDLLIVDGSEFGQENPIWPLIQPERQVDLIIVSDNGGTELSSGWMNGTTFVNTYLAAKAANLSFPEVPSVNTLINLNYTHQPTFFGCNDAPGTPLVLWMADAPYTAYSNISLVGNPSMTVGQYNLYLDNGFAAITQGNGSLRPNWSSCLACGTIYRSLQRLGQPIPAACTQCFTDYCWQGQVDDSPPSFYAPTLKLNTTLTFQQWTDNVLNKA